MLEVVDWIFFLGTEGDQRYHDTALSGFRMALPQLAAQLTRPISAEEPTSQTFLDFLAEPAWCAVDPEQSIKKDKTSDPTIAHTLRENQRKRFHPWCQTVEAFHASLHPICLVCQGENRVTTVCQRFLNQQCPEQRETAKRLGMCFICLSPNSSRRAPLSEEPDDATEPPGKKIRLKRVRKQLPVYCSPTHAAYLESGFKRGAENSLVTEDTAKTLGLVGVEETVTVKEISSIYCIQTLTRRICDDIQSVLIRCRDWKHLQHLQIPEEQEEKLSVHCHCVQIEDNMEHLLKKFWELESMGIQQQEEKTTQDTDPAKQREYTAVIEEYLRNGWAKVVTTQNGQPGNSRYLPHHAVYMIADGQTKCRIVFDGSAKYAGVSLNDQLEMGPNLMVSILLRFRQYRIAVQTDIAKMYLQVLKTHAELNPDESDKALELALANMYVELMW
ncbi:hypothetical protein T4C_2681 [Trichinella pseudospiralis]|uniref:Uncharacterized protein n=1 Tax=Trichinella pseudospiralis TaxID=6337 RepID=A0A0V1J824_TRIPS|nr:hypothetical protein T4C_2681 [Trichinella pseudospiralis]